MIDAPYETMMVLIRIVISWSSVNNLVFLPNLSQDQWRQLTLKEETLGLRPGHNSVDRLQGLELLPILYSLARRDDERIGCIHFASYFFAATASPDVIR